MSEILGVAVCDECSARIRVPPKYKNLVGKSIRCPRCHNRFRLTLELPTNSDTVAVETEHAEQKTRNQRIKRRRTKTEIRDEHVEEARRGFRALHSRLRTIADAPRASEEQIRIWCVDVLKTALGYSDESLDTECRVMGGRVDIAIKEGDLVKLVIECKNIRSKLRRSVREQAGVYAATLSAPWAVVTNGDIWKLYRVTPQPGRSPQMDLVFDVALLDEDGISEVDPEILYLLSSRALTSGDTEDEFHRVKFTSMRGVYKALFSSRVTNALRLQLVEQYKATADENVNLQADEATNALHALLTPLEFGS
ncbi:MAG: type I restriction enzyme HsdR N-terminal domain-containing protein [Fuerstiella sp.]